MTVQTPVASGIGIYSGDQAVVDTDDLTLLQPDLDRLGVPSRETDRIPPFDLALITFPGLAEAVGRLPAAAAGVRAELESRPGAPLVSDLDVLMEVLRRRFVEQHGRTLAIGKNRDMELMVGLPHWAGGEGLPELGPMPGFRPRDAVPGAGLRVGVLDTAMADNPALAGRFLSSDFVDQSAGTDTWAGHATFIVGRILLRAPGAVVEVREALSDSTGTASSWEVARGMASFLGSGVQVLNLSLGGFTPDDKPPFLMERAVERLTAEMVVVAAAGNHGNGTESRPDDVDGEGRRWRSGPLSNSSPMWPAALPGVVAVGAAAVERYRGEVVMTAADFTPPGVDWIGLWGPGVDVTSTYLTGRVTGTRWTAVGDQLVPETTTWEFTGSAVWSGTSSAAGDVTGEIAAVAQREQISAADAVRRLRARTGGKIATDDIRPHL